MAGKYPKNGGILFLGKKEENFPELNS